MEPVIIHHPVGDDPPQATLLYGQDVIDSLRTLPDQSAHTVCTSPPYWGLRDYGTGSWQGGDPDCDHVEKRQPQSLNKLADKIAPRVNPKGPTRQDDDQINTTQYRSKCGKCGAVRVDEQLGLEKTPEEYIQKLVTIFQEIRRVLRDDGTVWLNLGDTYAGYHGNAQVPDDEAPSNKPGYVENMRDSNVGVCGFKNKDLAGIPWAVAFALRADGWYLRQDIIWAKPQCMPESVRDRCTKSHEYIFLFTKNVRYYFDQDAIREPYKGASLNRYKYGLKLTADKDAIKSSLHERTRKGIGDSERMGDHMNMEGRNKRSIWTVNPKGYPGAHFAVWPPKLVEPMILAGTSKKGCCSKCGAPWKRLVEHSGGRDWRQDKMVPKGIPGELAGDGSYKRGQSSTLLNNNRIPTTVGWEPSCECGADPERCVVLDPFSGSATTGMVALDQGRNFIGIDLNADYLPLAQARILRQPPPDPEADLEHGGVFDLFDED